MVVVQHLVLLVMQILQDRVILEHQVHQIEVVVEVEHLPQQVLLTEELEQMLIRYGQLRLVLEFLDTLLAVVVRPVLEEMELVVLVVAAPEARLELQEQ